MAAVFFGHGIAETCGLGTTAKVEVDRLTLAYIFGTISRM